MPNATIVQSTLLGGFNQASLVTQIKTVMGQAGWTFDSETAGTTHSLWFRRVFAGTTYGTVYVLIRVPNIANSTLGYGVTYRAGFAADAQASGGGFPNFSSDVLFYAINHPEWSGFVWKQGSTKFSFGVCRPTNKPSWFSEGTHMYAHLYNYGTPGGVVQTFGAQPNTWGLSTALQRLTTSINVVNPRNGSAYEIQPVLALVADGALLGFFSSDLVTANYPTATTDLGDFLVVSSGVEEYFVVGNGIAVRST